MALNIVITDDHPMIAEGLKNMLSLPGIAITGIFSSARLLLEGIRSVSADLLLLDLHLPDMNGRELLPIFKAAHPDIPVLVVTSVDDPYEVLHMMQQGCKGYVLKTISAPLLLTAIETVHRGDTYIDPALKEKLDHIIYTENARDLQKVHLTKRETEVLQLLSQGFSNADIGKKLFLSRRTIESHRNALYEKFGVKNVGILIKKAIQLKYI